jgi:hypothetical protein
MTTIAVTLNDSEQNELDRRAKHTGQAPEAIVSEIVRRHLTPWNQEEWRNALTRTAGMWKDRDDLRDLAERLRREWDERLKRLES